MKLTKKVIKTFETSRKKLSKKAKSTARITYGAIMNDAGLEGKVSLRRLGEAVRKVEKVRWKHGRKRPERTENEVETRADQSGSWKGYSAEHWVEEIHGYLDTKTFCVPTTKAKKDLLQKLKIAGHLRKPGEGSQPEFLLPKKQHGGLGLPSVKVTACVSPSVGKITMWLPTKKWNGGVAEDMYRNHLKPALQKTYGELDYYRVVEDGDPTGFQSTKGKAGKKAAKIHSWKLPPRTPEWMPLDYALWHDIEGRALKSAGKKETVASYKLKLAKAAKGLGVSYVKRVCAAMRKRIKATFDAKGHHIKFD